VLEVQQLVAAYGSVEALHGISLRVEAGEIVTLIGANGAGKSTTLRTISGLLSPRSGAVYFDVGNSGASQKRDISRMSAEQIVQLGLAHVPEGRHVFPGLSVRDNLILGAVPRQGSAGSRWRAEVDEDMQRVLDLFPPLRRLLSHPSWTMSGGEQQMLAIGRGLMARPRLLLLDEPSLGLAPNLVRDVFHTIRRINEAGTTVLLVEQNARSALRIAHRGYVLETGRVTLDDRASTLLNNDQVKRAYLGSVVELKDEVLVDVTSGSGSVAEADPKRPE
jgi:branched-chain amino acid transport system ATP-binding protein